MPKIWARCETCGRIHEAGRMDLPAGAMAKVTVSDDPATPDGSAFVGGWIGRETKLACQCGGGPVLGVPHYLEIVGDETALRLFEGTNEDQQKLEQILNSAEVRGDPTAFVDALIGQDTALGDAIADIRSGLSGPELAAVAVSALAVIEDRSPGSVLALALAAYIALPKKK